MEELDRDLPQDFSELDRLIARSLAHLGEIVHSMLRANLVHDQAEMESLRREYFSESDILQYLLDARLADNRGQTMH